MMEIAETVRRAALEAALHAHEDAGLQGLCCEGRFEVAIAAIRDIDLNALIEKVRRSRA